MGTQWMVYWWVLVHYGRAFCYGLLDDKYILAYKYEQQICVASLM
jgi:hypothetical protein